jgi:succinate dehydrogenase/fumarate reductase flavoprotein subunit
MGGLSAAEHAHQKKSGQGAMNLLSETSMKRWERRASHYLKRKRGPFDPPGDLLKNLKDLAWRYAGPVREGGLMKEGLGQLASLEKRIERVYPATWKDLLKKRDLENAALVLKTILQGSLLRMESRGSFFRRDFPNQDDQNWMKNTCYRLEKGELQITHRPVKSANSK